jgi:DNA-binding NarL/FixJ family response regulator
MTHHHPSLRDLTMRPAKPERRKPGPKPMPPHFTPAELRLLDLLTDPRLENVKQIAHVMGWTPRSCNVAFSRLYKKLGIPGGTLRLGAIWAMTHEHVLPTL